MPKVKNRRLKASAFRNVIRQAVVRSGKTQRQISIEADIHEARLSHYLAADNLLLLPAFERLCGALNLELVEKRHDRPE